MVQVLHFTRDPATGENGLFGEFLTNAQGEDVVAGVRTPMHISEMEAEVPRSIRTVQRCMRDSGELTIEICRTWSLL